MGLRGLLLASAFSLAVSVGFQFWSLPAPKKLRFDLKILKPLLAFGFPLGLNGILTVVFQKIDTLLVGALVSPIGVAYYGVACKIPDSIPSLFRSFESAYLPTMSQLYGHKDVEQATILLNSCLRVVSFITITGALMVALFQREIVQLLFSEQYLPSAPTLSLLMIALNMELVIYVLGNTLVAAGQSDKPVKCNVVTIVVNILGNVVLIPMLGFVGAAWARIASRYAANPLNIWYLRRMALKVDAWGYIKPIVVFGLLWLGYQLFEPESAVLRLGLAGVFGFSCILLKIISKEDILWLLEAVRR
jgi:O-antigen/teichoic acid export membrane protein